MKVQLRVLPAKKIGILRMEYVWHVLNGCLTVKNVTKLSKIASPAKMVSITKTKNVKIVRN